jgi:hypothetical protein
MQRGLFVFLISIWFRMELINHNFSSFRSRSWLNRSLSVWLFTNTNIGEAQRMKISVCASAIVLATSVLLSNISPSSAVEFGGVETSQLATSVNIDRIKSVLRLTPEQQRYWPAVESALRDLGHRHQPTTENASFVRRVSSRVVSVVLDSAAVTRLAAAARPLILALNDEQRHVALSLAHEMGLGPVVAALN